MSDSASRKDVEDVLTSVRRLVSNEQPRKRRPDLPKGPGALVLTDAQRVERPVSRGLAAKSLEDRIAELEAAVSSRDDDYEPDGSEDQAQHRPDRIVYTRPPSDAEEAGARSATLKLSRLTLVEAKGHGERTGDDFEAVETEAVAFRHMRVNENNDAPEDSDAVQEAPMAEDVADPPREKAEVRPFQSPDAMLERFEARMDGGEPRPGPGHNGFFERLEPYQADETGAEADQLEAEDRMDLGAEGPQTVAVAEQPVDELDEDFEAALSAAITQPVADDSGDVQSAPEDDLQTVATSASQVASVSVAAPAMTVAALDTIDEDVLRPIVAKLIREELQGELGERITRNVRKLVRREILRAVQSREFE